MSKKRENDYIEDQEDRDKALRLLEALSGADEELVARSEEAGSANGLAGRRITDGGTGKTADRAVRFYRRGSKILAACFVFAVLGAVFGTANVIFQPKGSLSGQKEETPMEEMAYDSAGAAASGNTAAASGDGYGISDSGTDRNEETNTDTVSLQASKEGTESEAEKQGELSDGRAGENGAGNSAAAVTENGKVSSSQQAAASNSQQGTGKDDIENKEQNETADCLVDMEAIYKTSEEITEKEARAMEVLGSYIPTVIPAGYRFETAGRSISDDSVKELYILWTQGMDDIRLAITDYYAIMKNGSAEESLNIADPLKPETYDEHLYEIPYSDTVPSEYRAVFHDPVFLEADFSLEIVKARMKSYDDSGDTDTPRGNFSVLYNNGILVKFNGDGTAEDIWAMFQSIQP